MMTKIFKKLCMCLTLVVHVIFPGRVNSGLYSDSDLPPQILTVIYRGKSEAILKTVIFPYIYLEV